jgi:hypothetical protein
MTFVDQARGLNANMVEIVAVCDCKETPNAAYYDTNLPLPVFRDMMEMAAQHIQYSMRHCEVVSYHNVSGVVHQTISQVSGACAAPNAPVTTKTTHDRLVHVERLGASPVVCKYIASESVPVGSFSCSNNDVMDVRRTRRLILKVNQWSRLIFESYTDVNMTVVRSVCVRIDLSSPHTRSPDTRATIERTVQNTIQGVLLGSRLKTTPKQL